jgi:mono/diheme cytochrome c family protein
MADAAATVRQMTPSPARIPWAARLSASIWLLGVALLAGLLSGCGSGSARDVDGRALFASNCAVCHGTTGQGTDQGPSLREARYRPEQLSDADVADSIRNGVPAPESEYGPMPAFRQFDDAQVEALVKVVRELQG